jgi:7-carboxy-7-deazaguanine synthase
VKYPIYEQFYSWQGEGIHSGRAAYFVRLYGCTQDCFWCDSAGTWHSKYRPASITMLSADEIVDCVAKESPINAIVVITGGEPILFNLNPLINALHKLGRQVHLETSGIAELRGNPNWITLSPKSFAQHPLQTIVSHADEVKIIVYDPKDISAGLATLNGLREEATIWLHPEWSRAREQDSIVLNAISEAIKENPRLRAGYQIHKLYHVDKLDKNSEKTSIPLGGNTKLGF